MKPTRKQLIEEIVIQGYKVALNKYHGGMCPAIREIKPSIMRQFKLNRWDFDRLLLSEGHLDYYKDGINLASCGRKVSTNLEYVTFDHEHPTIMNSYCFFQINPEVARKIIERHKS